MKFTCIPHLGKEGGGAVWDAVNNKVLARFDKNGVLETTDERTISLLKEMGFAEVSGTTAASPEPVRGKRKQADAGEIDVKPPKKKGW